MSVPRQANQGWRRYWQEDRIESCVPDHESTAREINEHWILWFADLPSGSRILDIGTGNGVVLAHAAVAAERSGKRFLLTGVDLADIDPTRYLSNVHPGLQHAKFLGGVGAEQLPLADGEFDVVVSQYGLEYADLDQALAEVERVLVPGGCLRWLAHTEDSCVVQQNRDQGEQVGYLLALGGPLHAMRRFIAGRRSGKGLKRAIEELNAALAKAKRYCNNNPPAMVVREVCTVIAETAQRWQAYRLADLDRMLSDSHSRLRAHRWRINDLLAAVMSPVRLESACCRLQPPKWEALSFQEFRIGATASPIGMRIEARRGGT